MGDVVVVTNARRCRVLGSDVAVAMGATLFPEGGCDSESTFAFIFTESCCDKIGEAELRHLV